MPTRGDGAPRRSRTSEESPRKSSGWVQLHAAKQKSLRRKMRWKTK